MHNLTDTFVEISEILSNLKTIWTAKGENGDLYELVNYLGTPLYNVVSHSLRLLSEKIF